MPARSSRRPDVFRLNAASPLYQGLVLAGLGQHPGYTGYRDDGPGRRHGVLTGYSGAGDLPADRWGYEPSLGRRSLSFYRTNSNYVGGIRHPLTISDSFSVSFWAKLAATMDAFNGVASLQGTSNTDAQNIVDIYFGSSAGSFSASRLANGAYSSKILNALDSYTVWHHYMVTWSGTGRFNLYTDGVLNSQASPTLFYNGWPAANSMEIGSGYNHGLTFNGQLADMMVWSRVLSTVEIAAVASASNIDLRVGNVPLVSPPRRLSWAVAPVAAAPSGDLVPLSRGLNTGLRLGV